MTYLISLWIVWRPRALLYFLISKRAGVLRRLLLVVYREGDFPSFRASVHSRVILMRTPFFLAATSSYLDFSNQRRQKPAAAYHTNSTTAKQAFLSIRVRLKRKAQVLC